LARLDPAFDSPMILFQDVARGTAPSMLAVLLQSVLDFELHNRRRITGVLVGVDYPRRRMLLTAEGISQEVLSGRWIAFGREKEVDRLPIEGKRSN